ncbi:MAG: TOBE domain-containing protein, partial [Burkholderiales bacterium]|nr:TOBE domain-containing protein [Burkholderiales bacterium]
AARARAAAGPFKLGVRPENLLPAAPAGPALKLPAQVSLLEPLGSETLVTLRLGGAEMIARWPAAFRAAPGTAVEVHLDPAHLHLFESASGAAV